ncbi:serine O-acetyltransferase [Aerococcus urinaeequi]
MNIISYSLRVLNWFYKHKIPLIPKFIRIFNRLVFSCDIPANLNISSDIVYAHHGLGIVINQNAKIQSNTKILHGVTIGGSGKTRHYDGENIVAPIIGKGVLIGSHAQIIGPIIVGDNAIIGAGAVVTKDVPPGATVVGNPARIL